MSIRAGAVRTGGDPATERTSPCAPCRARALIAGGVVDRYHLYVHPLVLGTGKRLFRGYDRPLRLRLDACSQTGTGVLVLTYSVG